MAAFKSEVVVLVPTLNEADAIAGVVKSVPKTVSGMNAAVVVVDGNSQDGTADIARKAGAFVISQKSRGKGAAIREALEQLDGRFVVLMDGDGTYDAGALPQLVSPLADGSAGMVVATRMAKREAGAITPFNVLGNKIFNWLIRLFYGQNITDMLSGYRAVSKSTLDSFQLRSGSFEVETELTIEALRNGVEILEVPAFYRKRTGRTKLNPISDGFRIMGTLVTMIRETRPLSFFGAFSLLFFLAGLYPASLVLSEKLSTGIVQHLPSAVLAAFLFLLSIQLFAVGLLADLQVNSARRIEYLIRKRK